MRSQIREAAALWSLNFWMDWTPGRLLQIASSRFAGHLLAHGHPFHPGQLLGAERNALPLPAVARGGQLPGRPLHPAQEGRDKRAFEHRARLFTMQSLEA